MNKFVAFNGRFVNETNIQISSNCHNHARNHLIIIRPNMLSGAPWVKGCLRVELLEFTPANKHTSMDLLLQGIHLRRQTLRLTPPPKRVDFAHPAIGAAQEIHRVYPVQQDYVRYIGILWELLATAPPRGAEYEKRRGIKGELQLAR